MASFGRDRPSKAALERIKHDVDTGLASGQVHGTPTLIVDGVVHRGGYCLPTMLATRGACPHASSAEQTTGRTRRQRGS
jgi:hypothetical protein